MNHPTEPDKLLKPQVPYDTGMLEVGDGHRLYYEQCGPEDGLPIVFLHGGPGSGCSARHRQLFDLQRFRVILFDQRGCARSQPRGSLLANTSAHLIADIERLRQHVGVDQWLVLGGSWGAGLALAYAAAHKSSCLGLVLRGVFLGRESDTQWFFQHVGQLLPEAWQALLAQTPPAARTHVLHWICAQVNSQDTLQALSAACAWETWETAVTQRRHAVPRASLPRVIIR